jgi:hypothetical protein
VGVLGVSRQNEGSVPAVTVRQASAMHVTKRELGMAK